MTSLAQFNTAYKAFMKAVHPDKFLSISPDAFRQNTRVVQTMNIIYQEILALYENSTRRETLPFSASGEALVSSIRYLFPPTAWYVDDRNTKRLPSTSSLSQFKELVLLVNQRLAYPEPISLQLLLSICKLVFEASLVEKSVILPLPDVSLSPNALKKEAPSKKPFGALFSEACRKEDDRFSKTILGKIACPTAYHYVTKHGAGVINKPVLGARAQKPSHFRSMKACDQEYDSALVQLEALFCPETKS